MRDTNDSAGRTHARGNGDGVETSPDSGLAPAWLRANLPAVAALVLLDLAGVVASTTIAFVARFEGRLPPEASGPMPMVVAVSAVVYLSCLAAFGLYRTVLRYVGVDTALSIAGAVASGAGILLILDLVNQSRVGERVAPLGVLFFAAVMLLVWVTAVRLSVRVGDYVRASRNRSGQRLLIVGAGYAGSLLLREIEHEPELGLHPIGFVDDNPRLQGRRIRGVSVLGGTAQIRQLVAESGADEVFLAMPSAPESTTRRILNEVADTAVKTRIMPRVVAQRGSVSLRDLRKVEITDLLGRESSPIDVDQIAGTISGEVVAVTGAAGSIGAELCRQLMSLGPDRLVLIESDESRLYELWLELERLKKGVARMRICDVRDQRKVERVLDAERPCVVLHAAAYKHVPLMEQEPDEAVKANVLATRVMVEACERFNVRRFVLISTDKAVNPESVMGMTKAIAERVLFSHASEAGMVRVAVRFGNVLGSRGSVVPIFEEQLRRGGPITVTHEETTRYFMTIAEAARLVLQAQAITESGNEVFVLDMGKPVKIIDLARRMIALSGAPADIEIVGMRPAEKLHEVLVTGDEELLPTRSAMIQRLSHTPVPTEGFDVGISRLIALAEAGEQESIRGLCIELLEPGLDHIAE